MSQSSRPHILVLPSGTLVDEILSPRAWDVLESLGTVERNTRGRNLTAVELAARLPGVTAVMTTWGTPEFDTKLLEAATDLRIIGHAAGSIKRMTPAAVFSRGIVVTHGASVIGESVGEWALTSTLMALRIAHTFDRAMQGGQAWRRSKGTDVLTSFREQFYNGQYGRELYRKRVGIIAASMTGRVFIRLLQPFDVEISVYDPYLSDDQATTLGVRRATSLDELMINSDIISNHAPTTAETNGMVGEKQLSLLPDGALFVNTARAAAIDYEALTRELQSGRIGAALDVFPQEPLATDSPLCGLPNVILSPHVAGATIESRARLGETMADEFARFFSDQPLRYQVTAETLRTMA